MKSVLISIQPKWCELIANRKKTIEVRKTMPKIPVPDCPFKCYIYETLKGKYFEYDGDVISKEYTYRGKGKVIGEFICWDIDTIDKRGVNNNFDYCYESLNVWGNDDIEIEITDIKNSCIPKNELNEYGKNAKCLYAWHISNLKIYDNPKELSEFNLKRPPQSWCYVESEVE